MKINKLEFNELLKIIVFLCLVSPPIHSQSAGFVGKKLILKTNIINGTRLGFNNLDLEYAVSRNITLGATYQLFNYTLSDKGISAKTGIIKPGNDRDEVKEVSTLKSGTTKGWIASINGRYYFDKVIPAPYGYYVGIALGFGSASFSDFSVNYQLKDLSTYQSYNNSERHEKAAIENLSGESTIVYFELPNVGYQRIFKRIITLDFNFAFQGQYCALPENLLNAMEHNYFTRSNVIGFGTNNLNMGLAIYVKFGVLVF